MAVAPGKQQQHNWKAAETERPPVREGQPHRQQGCSSVWQLGSWFLHPPVCRAALWDPEEVGAEINDILVISLSGLLLSIRIAG